MNEVIKKGESFITLPKVPMDRNFIFVILILFCGCYQFLYERYDFTPRKPVPTDSVEVYTKVNPPPYSYKAIVGMIYGPQFKGGGLPSQEEAVAKFKEKAASLGCDAIIFLGLKTTEVEDPGGLYWIGDKPYYTGSGRRTVGAWTAIGIVFK